MGSVSPQPPTYRVYMRNSQVRDDWNRLKQTRYELCKRCWDHISTLPTTPIGTRYLPLSGPMKYVEFKGQQLRQWQYEIDRGARVKIGVGGNFVVIVSVSIGHPKENE